MNKKMLEISILKNYGPSNLNRDEGGNPKDCIFGGVLRGRISSQCLKRSIRKSDFFTNEIGDSLIGIRTVHMPEYVADLLEKKGYDKDVAKIAAGWLAATGKKNEKKSDEDIEEENDDKNIGLKTKQIMFFSPEEIQSIASVTAKVIDEKGKDAKVLKKVKDASSTIEAELKKLDIKPTCVDMAMFGRMITSNAFKNVEASVQVAHAISTNKLEREFDFFTAVDDSPSGEEMQSAGSDMLGDTGFNSNCYYMYCAIDLDELQKNLSALGEKAESIARKAVIGFIKALAYANPSGKQNSFAAHALPGLLSVTLKNKKIPVNLADAFIKPAKFSHDKDLMQDSVEKITHHIDKLDKRFSETKPEKRLWFTMDENAKIPQFADVYESFDDLLKSLGECI